MPLPDGFTEFDPTQTGNPPSGFSDISNEPDWGGVVRSALNEASMGNGSKMRDLMTDPITQAKVLPYLAQGVGTILPTPMGATKGYAAGRALSDAALASYGRSDLIPSKGKQALEAGGSILGDLTAIPAIKKASYGNAIGDVETAAGIPDPTIHPEAYPSLPRPGGPQTVSNAVDDAVGMVNDPAVEKTPIFWKRLKDQIDWIYSRGKDEAMSKLDKIKLSGLSTVAENNLNQSVLGRAPIAEDMSNSLAAPRAIEKAWTSLPPRVRAGIQFFAPTAGIGGGLAEIFKMIGGGSKGQ